MFKIKIGFSYELFGETHTSYVKLYKMYNYTELYNIGFYDDKAYISNIHTRYSVDPYELQKLIDLYFKFDKTDIIHKIKTSIFNMLIPENEIGIDKELELPTSGQDFFDLIDSNTK